MCRRRTRHNAKPGSRAEDPLGEFGVGQIASPGTRGVLEEMSLMGTLNWVIPHLPAADIDGES